MRFFGEPGEPLNSASGLSNWIGLRLDIRLVLWLFPAAPPKGPDVPKVTIITATYNQFRFLPMAVASVLGQTELDWELIVVDDGSTDDTEHFMGSRADSTISYVRLKHRGIWSLSETYNTALDMARGNYVAVLEGDDFWPRQKLRQQLPLFREENVVLTWGRVARTDIAGQVQDTTPAWWVAARLRRQSSSAAISSLLKGNYIGACTVMCRRQALLELGGFQQPPGLPNVDYPTWLNLARMGDVVGSTVTLGYWRRHDTQVSSSMRDAMQANAEWVDSFVEALPPRERRELGLGAPKMGRIVRRRAVDIAYSEARIQLRNKNIQEASRLLKEGARHGPLLTRFKAWAHIRLLRCCGFGSRWLNGDSDPEPPEGTTSGGVKADD